MQWTTCNVVTIPSSSWSLLRVLPSFLNSAGSIILATSTSVSKLTVRCALPLSSKPACQSGPNAPPSCGSSVLWTYANTVQYIIYGIQNSYTVHILLQGGCAILYLNLHHLKKEHFLILQYIPQIVVQTLRSTQYSTIQFPAENKENCHNRSQ